MPLTRAKHLVFLRVSVDINTTQTKEPIWAPGTVRKVRPMVKLVTGGRLSDPHLPYRDKHIKRRAYYCSISMNQAAYLQLSTMKEYKTKPQHIADDDIGASISVHFDTGDWAHVVCNRCAFCSVHIAHIARSLC